MNSLYELNGLQFFDEDEIHLRNGIAENITRGVQRGLLSENSAWTFHQCEAPILTPWANINPNYTAEDVWAFDDLVCRPETTPGSYVYAKHILDGHNGVKPPFVVWQLGKSFRREVDQPSKHCRYKEFYQQEFQCFFTVDTMNDYQEAMLEPMRAVIAVNTGLPTRIVESDRLPSYSKRTMDVEVNNGDKWMEICSISLRTDCPFQANFVTKKGVVTKDLLVLEIAVGLDRCVYNRKIWEGSV